MRKQRLGAKKIQSAVRMYLEKSHCKKSLRAVRVLQFFCKFIIAKNARKLRMRRKNIEITYSMQYLR